MTVEHRKRYLAINLAVLLLALAVLAHAYDGRLVLSLRAQELSAFFATACAVFGLKLVRLYLVFVNTGLRFRTHALQFFKTLLVSLVVLALAVYAVGRLLKKDKCRGCPGCGSGKC